MKLARQFELFDAALELASDERASYLADQCGEDTALLDAVLGLLRSHEGAPPLVAPDGLALVGRTIDGFTIRRSIAVGGMGAVFEAEQTHPKRRVALKLLRHEIDTPDARARFEREAHVLGRLSHPGVARIHDAGALELDGSRRPYLVLEFVDGQTLDAFARERALDDRARLELVARVADVVEHAHQTGVVHRDLKPSNVMVDAQGAPRVLDFGIARLVDEEVGATLTHTGQVFGTLPYMAPEQVAGERGSIDARTDVYALGVLAYELVCGALPLEFEGLSLPEAARRILEAEPPRLGQRDRRWRGDVEAVIGTALAKEPARRYSSMGAFAADLRRILEGAPVEARPPSVAYHFTKFAARHRWAVASAVLVVGLLGAALVVTLGALRDAHAAEADTRLALGDARDERDKFAEISRVLRELFDTADPTRSSGPDTTVRQALDRAAARLPRELEQRPDVLAPILGSMGASYLGLGEYERAAEELQRAVELARASDALEGEDRDELEFQRARLAYYEGDHRASADALSSLVEQLEGEGNARLRRNARLMLAYARFELEERESAFALLRANLDELLAAGQPFDVARTQLSLAQLLLSADLLQEAESLSRAAWNALREPEAQEDDLARAELQLGSALVQLGRSEEGMPLLDSAVARFGLVLGEGHSTTAHAVFAQGEALHRSGLAVEAEPVMREALDGLRRALGDEHRDSAAARVGLAGVLRTLRRHAEAAEELELALEVFEAQGYENSRMSSAYNMLSAAYVETGELQAAEEAIERSIELQETARERNPTTFANTLGQRGRIALQQGQLEEAVSLYRESVALLEVQEDELATALARLNLGVVLKAAEQYEEAESTLLRSKDAMAELLDADDPRLGEAHGHLGSLYSHLERWEEAAQQTELHLENRWSYAVDPPVEQVRWKLILGDLWFKAQAYPETERLWSEALEICRRNVSAEHGATTATRRALQDLREAWDDEPARERLRILLEQDS